MDALSAATASQLATRIHLFWASKGVSGVKVWAEPLPIINDFGKPTTVYQVRSNIVERIRELAHSDPML